MSSNKNLKVYKMQFMTEIKTLHMNVKFNCKIKATWKRSNESAETTWVPLQSGAALFNQTLKLNVNMYFDTIKNKFVEKKCLYSFVISTEKGEKSAGSVTIDLAEFFNKRVYEMNEVFNLEKCPVKETKIQLRIYYEEDATEQDGYDSISCISSTNQMDNSMASDLGDIVPTGSFFSEVEIEKSQKSEPSDLSTSKTEQTPSKVQEENYGNLDESDVIDYPIQSSPSAPGSSGSPSKIGQNIKTINTLTSKIDKFVTDKTKGLKYQIESFHQKINSLEESLRSQKNQNQKLQTSLAEQKAKSSQIQKEYSNFKISTENELEIEKSKCQDLQSKCSSNQSMLAEMEGKMSENGQSQSSYIQTIKDNHEKVEVKLKAEIEEMRGSLVEEKRNRNDLNSKMTDLEAKLQDLRQKYTVSEQKNASMQDDMHNKQQQLEATRVNLERTYEHLLASLNNVLL